LLKKYAKKLDKKELPRFWPTLARIFVGLSLTTIRTLFKGTSMFLFSISIITRKMQAGQDIL
jgi:hypothetical protein